MTNAHDHTTARSRGAAVTGEAVASSATLPRKWRVLPVVAAARVVPIHAERMHVAALRMREREAVGCRMPGVVELHRLGGVGVDTHRAFSRHVEEATGADRPVDACTRELDRRRLDAEELAEQPRLRGHRTARGAADDRRDRVA